MYNKVSVTGIATGEFKVNHQFRGQDNKLVTALETEIVSTTANEISNVIKVIVLKDTLFEQRLKNKGEPVTVKGFIQNFNKQAYGKRISEVFVKPTHVQTASLHTKEKNTVELKGQVCGTVKLKTRHNGRLVAETKVKVARTNGGFDYIPVVAFDENARILEMREKDSFFSLKGRIHSRSFLFKYEENGVQKDVERTALEVCAHELKMQGNVEEDKVMECAKLYCEQSENASISYISETRYDISGFLMHQKGRRSSCRNHRSYRSASDNTVVSKPMRNTMN